MFVIFFDYNILQHWFSEKTNNTIRHVSGSVFKTSFALKNGLINYIKTLFDASWYIETFPNKW